MKDVICWWSGGITSAVACKLAIDLFGADRCRVIMIDTRNEDADTYRFMADCAGWYNIWVERINAFGGKYESIADVWDRHSSLNVAHGAICSTELKRQPRIDFQKTNKYTHQVFGYELTKREASRALAMTLNNPDAKPIFPLLMYGMDKRDCIKYVEDAGLTIPAAYSLGFQNNNCLQTGCVQGGIGYWQKVKVDSPVMFDAMAEREHRYTDNKGKPVTILKDQSKAAKESGNVRVFLKPHPDYPGCKTVSDFKGQKVENLTECNGFCGTNDLLNG